MHNILKGMIVYYKCYTSIELTFLKELMSIKQVHQMSVMCVIISLNQMSSIDIMIY